MRKLTYFIDRGNDEYEPFYEYHLPQVGVDEIYARQLCTYFIMKGIQYELISNEMLENEEVLVLSEMGPNQPLPDEQIYRGKGLNVEFRSSLPEENYRLLHVRPCASHYEVIRFLLKDVVDIPFIGQMYTTSTEIDEDRGVYVVYVKEIGTE